MVLQSQVCVNMSVSTYLTLARMDHVYAYNAGIGFFPNTVTELSTRKAVIYTGQDPYLFTVACVKSNFN